MPIYEFLCDACLASPVIRLPYEEAGRDRMCTCGGALRRVYGAPHVVIAPTATEVLNRAARGEGDPMPGKTREETRQAALALAESNRRGPTPDRDRRRGRPSAPKTFHMP